jgi:hypothetical protein
MFFDDMSLHQSTWHYCRLTYKICKADMLILIAGNLEKLECLVVP